MPVTMTCSNASCLHTTTTELEGQLQSCPACGSAWKVSDLPHENVPALEDDVESTFDSIEEAPESPESPDEGFDVVEEPAVEAGAAASPSTGKEEAPVVESAASAKSKQKARAPKAGKPKTGIVETIGSNIPTVSIFGLDVTVKLLIGIAAVVGSVLLGGVLLILGVSGIFKSSANGPGFQGGEFPSGGAFGLGPAELSIKRRQAWESHISDVSEGRKPAMSREEFNEEFDRKHGISSGSSKPTSATSLQQGYEAIQPGMSVRNVESLMANFDSIRTTRSDIGFGGAVISTDGEVIWHTRPSSGAVQAVRVSFRSGTVSEKKLFSGAEAEKVISGKDSNPKVTDDNFAKIKSGMTLRQVEENLGPGRPVSSKNLPEDLKQRGDVDKWYAWYGSSRTIYVGLGQLGTSHHDRVAFMSSRPNAASDR